jgi:hypothetical protein
MSKLKLVCALLLALSLSACNSEAEKATLEADAAGANAAESWTATPSEIPPPTNTPAPTLTPTATSSPTPTSSATPTPTPTTDPMESLIGSWRCESCPFHTYFEFVDAGNGLQFIIMRPEGEQIEWMGPDRCENIYIAYYECSVTIGTGGMVTVSYIEHVSGQAMPECGTHKEQEFQLQDGMLVRTRYDMTSPCAAGGSFYQNLLEEFSPWSPYQKVER